MKDLQRSALAEAVHEWNGAFQPDAFRSKYGKEPELGTTRAHYGRHARPSLLRLFLHRSSHEDLLRVPDELMEPLRELLPPPQAAALAATAELPQHYPRPRQRYDREAREYRVRTEPVPLVVRETEAAARHDLTAVLALADAGQVAITSKKRHPTSGACRAVARVLLGGDFYAEGERERWSDDDEYLGAEWDRVGPIRAFAWPLLLQAGGLARPWGGKLRLTERGRAALGASPSEILADLWTTWTDSDLLDELSRVEAIRGQSGRGRRSLVPADSRRPVVADALADCPPGRWVAVDELWRYMRAAGHDFEVTRDPWDLYIEEKQYGSLGYDGYHPWEILQGRYVLAVLMEYAATLGLVDVAYVPPHFARVDYRHLWGVDDHEFLSRYDGLAHIRLTPLGAYCLEVTEEYAPGVGAAGATLTVLPNLEVAVLEGAEVSPADRLLLERFGEPVSERVWRLDRDRILAAIEEGHDPAALRELLTSRGGGTLPDAAGTFLDEIADRAGRLREAGRALLVDCGGEEMAALLASDRATRSACLRAGERHVAVPAGKEAAFRRGLRRLGYVLPPGR
jgi:hypothetical protein